MENRLKGKVKTRGLLWASLAQRDYQTHRRRYSCPEGNERRKRENTGPMSTIMREGREVIEEGLQV